MSTRMMEETRSVQSWVKSYKTVSVNWSSLEVRSGPAAIWQLWKGSRDTELTPLTDSRIRKTKSLLPRGKVKSHFCLHVRFICAIK